MQLLGRGSGVVVVFVVFVAVVIEMMLLRDILVAVIVLHLAIRLTCVIMSALYILYSPRDRYRVSDILYIVSIL